MLGEMKHMVGHRWESSAGEMWNSWDTFPNFAPEERGEADMLIAFGKYDYANVTLAPKWWRNNKISARSDRKRDQ